jgi:multiple sugar transport system substrate-binding protein
MSMKLNRRQVLAGASALAGGAIMAGMGSAGAARAAESAHIRFGGYVESQEQLKHTIAVLKAYSDKHPGVEIVPEFTNFSAFTDKLATEAAGGNAPDMFSVNVDLLYEYAKRGVATALDSYNPKPLDLSDYLPGAIKGASMGGHLYAIPNDAIGPSLYMNTVVLKDAGVTVPDQMWTWDALADMALAISKAKGPRFWGLSDAGANYIPCDIFLRGMGKSMFTPDHKFGFAPKDLAEWFAYWDKLRKAGGIPPGDVAALGGSGDPSATDIVNGRSAMYIELTDSFVGVQALLKDKLVLHMMPNGFKGDTLTQHHYTYAGNSTAVWSKSKNPDTIIDIIKFMHSDPEGSKIYYTDSGMIPASKAARDVVVAQGGPAVKEIADYLELLQKNPAPPRYPGVTGMSGMLQRANEGVAFGKLTPQQAADQFVQEAGARL